MARPRNTDYRSDILNAFDRNGGIGTVTNVNKHLKEVDKFQSIQSTRRMLIRMVREGLITELPKRGDKNQIFYIKANFKNVTRFANYTGDNVSLREFIHTLLNDVNPDVINPEGLTLIKTWMLDVLGSTIPVAYASKGRDTPKPEELKKRLENVLSMTRKFHAFLKTFVDSDIWSDTARERLAKEFNNSCVEEHAGIVDRVWLKND